MTGAGTGTCPYRMPRIPNGTRQHDFSILGLRSWVEGQGRSGSVPGDLSHSAWRAPEGKSTIANRESKIAILAYHKIRPVLPGERRPALVVTPAAFEEHVAALQRWGYRLGTFQEFERARAERLAILTFDDGFASVFEHAWARLSRVGAPAVIFLVSGRIGGYNDFPGNRDLSRERLLDAAQIREMAAAGAEFGSHTVSHSDLTRLDDGALRRELADSRAAIEDLAGREVAVVAYPYGYLDERVVAAAREAGYRYGVTTVRGTRQAAGDLLRLRRVAVGGRVGAWRLRYRLSILYEWEHAWKRRREQRRSR